MDVLERGFLDSCHFVTEDPSRCNGVLPRLFLGENISDKMVFILLNP